MNEEIATWQERLNSEGLYDTGTTLFGGWSAETMARDAEIADLRAELARSEESVSQYQQSAHELAEELRLARRATAGTTAPVGYKLVPVEPTQHMIDRGADAIDSRLSTIKAGDCYRRMLTAGPDVAGTTAAPSSDMQAKRAEVIDEVLDALHASLEYPTEACAIVRTLKEKKHG
jgi:hypothetical protein